MLQKGQRAVDVVSTMPYHPPMNVFKWNVEQNEVLARERGITFEEIVQRMESGCKVIEVDHPNKKKYLNQRLSLNLNQ